MPDQSDTWQTPLRVADLRPNRSLDISVTPDATVRAQLARALGLLDLRKLRLTGTLAPLGKRDWQFTGQLGATVVQPCVVTLDPVTTRIDVPVLRSFVAGYVAPDPGSETEMDADDTVEPLTDVIDPALILEESLALALPDYPRADGAESGEMVFAQPGIEAMRDDEARPFAGLAGLRDKLARGDPENE